MANPDLPTALLSTATTGGSKDGGAFHAIINAGPGDNGCILSISKTTTSLTSTLGRGGLYSCTGVGKSSITFSEVSMDTTVASGSGPYQKHGGIFYVDVNNAVTMSINKSNFTLQSCDHSGGFAYLKGSTVNAHLLGKTDI